MKKLIAKIFFIKPRIIAKLIRGGSAVSVKVSSATSVEQIFLILFMLTKQLAQMLKMEHRQLLNKLVDFDKQIIKNAKQEEKAVRRQIYGNKK